MKLSLEYKGITFETKLDDEQTKRLLTEGSDTDLYKAAVMLLIKLRQKLMKVQ